MLSQEERYRGQRNAALAVLMQDMEAGNNEALQIAYEQANISNAMLVQRLKKDRSIAFMPQKMIFMDMCILVYELAEKDRAIISTLQDYYSKRHPDVVKAIQKAKQCYEAERSFDKEVNYLQGFKRFVYIFLAYGEDIFNEKGYLESFHQQISEGVYYSYLMTDKDVFSQMPVNFNTGEPIFESKVFQRWIEKRKEALAEYLSSERKAKVTVNNLNKELQDMFRSHSDENHVSIPFDDVCFPNWMSRNIMIEHHGGSMWIDAVTNDGKTGYHTHLGYKPDMNFLVEMYYKIAVVYNNNAYRLKNGEDMTRVFLSRELITNPRDDIVSLGYMYNLDVVTKLFDDMVAEYYKNFSWEKITRKAFLARYENIIARLSDQINLLQAKLASAHQANADIRRQLTQSNNASLIPFEQENAALSKKLEQKEEEIITLKRQLQSKDEYLELILTKEEEVQEEIDIEALQQKRYLFVGFKGQITNELKKQFPSSSFMDSETFNLNGIQVDAIVMLISIMNHAMFYKVNSTAALEGLPVVRVNTRNLNTIYREMYRV